MDTYICLVYNKLELQNYKKVGIDIIMNNQKYEHIINKIYEDSIAEELELEVGDVLLEVNGHVIKDVFDYRYYMKDEYVEILIRKTDGEEWLLEIDKDYDEELGVEFENSLMSEYKSCSNKCIFCFIDQMPKGMRDTLYFKDDDSRLSFLQGNYITLTNMKDDDIGRIVNMNLAPINISIQSMNPELRCKMLNNRFAGEKLKYLKVLFDNQIEMNGQIVLCKGVNDGEELRYSIETLAEYLPFMRSVSVVPAGITKYRDGLFPLEMFDSDEAADVIDMIEDYQKKFYDEYGLHFIHASDEWYISAGREFPEEERYDGYIQLENGVGMMRLLIEEVNSYLEEIIKADNEDFMVQRTVTIATGLLAYETIKMLAEKVSGLYKNVKINVVGIKNRFFGETITVTGLITGADLIYGLEQYKKDNSLGDAVLISSCMIRSGERVFLDDVTIEDVAKRLGVKVVMTDSNGEDFVKSIVDDTYSMDRDNENMLYIDAFE